MDAVRVTNTRNRPLKGQRSQNRLLTWIGRALLGLLTILALLAVVGASYQILATRRDAKAFPPPGQMIDVGGYNMHIVCTGPQNTGNPTVILDHVGAANTAQWALVQPEIAKTTRVCAYDRAGFGWSESGPTPRDAGQSMRELHTLLGNAAISAPYILVGHSYGGNVARLYVAEYPDDVVGMVLVDPGHPFDVPGVPAEINAFWKTEDQTVMRLAPYLSRLGVMRLAAALGAVPGHGDLPPSDGAAYDAANLSTKFWDALSDQNEAMVATSKEVLGTPQDLGTLPLIVLSATLPDDKGRQAWTQLNAELATHSSNGLHLVVNGATHMSFALEQDESQTTVEAILQVIRAARTGQLLGQK